MKKETSRTEGVEELKTLKKTRKRMKIPLQRCRMKTRRVITKKAKHEEEEDAAHPAAAAAAAAAAVDCYAYNLEDDEAMYAKDAPVLCLKEKEDPTIEVKNDYEFTPEEFDSYYLYSKEQIKDCGCTAGCGMMGGCCSTGLFESCRDNCGCLCYKDSGSKDFRKSLKSCRYSYEKKELKMQIDSEKRFSRSGGFDIKAYYHRHHRSRPRNGELTPMEPLHQLKVLQQDLLKKLAILAIKRYNQMKETEYRCLRFVKAVRKARRGFEYYITFIAADDKGKGKTQTFQARVSNYMKGPRNYERKVRLCRPKPIFI